MKRTLIFASLAAALCASASTLAADAFVTGDVVLRAGPDPEYPAVADLREGTAVSVQGCVRNYSWCDVAAHGERGWVAGEFLQEEYQGRRVVLTEYGTVIGIPIVSFEFVSYWDTHYRSRPWYGERTRYQRITPRFEVGVSARSATTKSVSGTAAASGGTTRSGTATATVPGATTTTSGTATTTSATATTSATTSAAGTARANDNKVGAAVTTREPAASPAKGEGARRATAEAGGARVVEQDSSPQRAVKSDAAKPETGQASAQRDDDKSAIEPQGEHERPAQARAKAAERPGPKAQQPAKPEQKQKDKDKDKNPDDEQQ